MQRKWKALQAIETKEQPLFWLPEIRAALPKVPRTEALRGYCHLPQHPVFDSDWLTLLGNPQMGPEGRQEFPSPAVRPTPTHQLARRQQQHTGWVSPLFKHCHIVFLGKGDSPPPLPSARAGWHTCGCLWSHCHRHLLASSGALILEGHRLRPPRKCGCTRHSEHTPGGPPLLTG